MGSLLGAAALLWVAQLDPSLVPHPAPQPAVPKIDRPACPFEGCRFGKWTVTEPVQLYSTWRTPRGRVRVLNQGEAVVGITGVHITFEPSEIEITAPMPQYGLVPGDRVFGYMNIGEGFFNAWFKGQWVEEFDGGTITAPNGGCNRDCTGRMLKESRTEWWVGVKAEDGVTGWTKEWNKFDGIDALASGPEPRAPRVRAASTPPFHRPGFAGSRTVALTRLTSSSLIFKTAADE
jgi:hypothetical protein